MRPIFPPPSDSDEARATNLARLKELFPELVTEGKEGASVNVDVLKQLVGDKTLTDADEKFGLSWFGKRQARQLALTPSRGTLRPAPEESVDWDTTKNLMIEGDNLEVLKLLQKSYAGKVKLIYIDPPYNTGNDFVYPDDFTDGIRKYKELTGQTEDGKALTSNAESSGRFHTAWLNMMYPRLKVARELLRKDGAIFISIDDHEIDNLRKICNEIFGEENFVGCFVWKRRSSSALADRMVSTDHEYLLAYQRSDFVSRGIPKEFDQYTNPDNDHRGPWVAGDLTVGMNKDLRPNQFYPITDPDTGISYPPNPNRVWAYIRESMAKLIAEKRILFPSNPDRRPMLKRFKCELKSDSNPVSTWMTEVGLNTESTRELQQMFGQNPFDYAKPLSLLSHIVKTSTGSNDLILDFFAGSGTSGQATLETNASETADRRYILVQFPEPLQSEVFATIAEVTKERLRRAGAKVKAENPDWKGDTGFRVFKLDSSNIRIWDPNPENLEQTLLDHVTHLKPDRSEADIFCELLLRLGIDLTSPIEEKTIAGKSVRNAGEGILFACLTPSITRKDVEPLALGIADWRKQVDPTRESTVVFRDDAFADEASKANLTAILRQHGFHEKRIRSL